MGEKIDSVCDDENRPLRVAQIIGKMWAGGVETVVFNYYKELDHEKVQFDFFYDADSTVEPPRQLRDMGARFYQLPPYQKILQYLPSLKRIFEENKYIIVHSHLNTLSIFPLFIAWVSHVPIRIVHNHSVPGGREWKRNILKNTLKHFSKLFATDYFACSEKAGKWLFGEEALKAREIVVLNNAIDFSKFQVSRKDTLAMKRKLKLDGKFVVGHVGRFTYAKNHEKLLNIFNELHKKKSDARLLLVGDGELHGEIMKKISELHLDQFVVCVGKVRNPESYYALMDVLLLPSLYEGFSLTTIESQAAGVPVIASDIVPKETCISNACEYMNISTPDIDWADNAIDIAEKKVVLLETADNFNIKKRAKELQAWYLRRSEPYLLL